MTGQLQYTADMKFHMLYAKMLFSPVAHAKLLKKWTLQAEALPGVKAVVTYKNSPRIPYNICVFMSIKFLKQNTCLTIRLDLWGIE